MSKHLGDYATSKIIYGKFTTFRPSTGAAFTLGGSPALSVYKDNSTTQSTSGVTLTPDFDAVTGLNHFAIDTSADGAFYSSGSNFDIVITAGTVDSVSVVGTVVASFSLQKVAALRPTTADRTLTVSAAGAGDANVTQVAGQTASAAGAVTFPGTIASTTNITAGTITTTTNLTNLPSIPNNWITAAGINAGALNGKGDWLLSSSYTAAPSVSAIWTTGLTESYAANGAEFTGAQALYAIHQWLMEFTISGTTYSVKKLDSSTAAFTGTLNDGTNPTGVTR